MLARSRLAESTSALILSLAESGTVERKRADLISFASSLLPLATLRRTAPSRAEMVTKRRTVHQSPLEAPARPLLALGLEGSANKLGAGLILHSPPAASSHQSLIGDPATVSILSNIRHTYVTPPGEGFLPSDTARHHKRWIAEVVDKALTEAGKTMHDVDVICFTKGAQREIGTNCGQPQD